jgi:tripartite-type tricarboxylate transporter receptor subunit TctC
MRITGIGYALVFFLFGAAAAAHAQPQQYPSKPIRIVAPFPASGTADFLARLLADKLNQKWGQTVIRCS